jgi:hypothetical protein
MEGSNWKVSLTAISQLILKLAKPELQRKMQDLSHEQ